MITSIVGGLFIGVVYGLFAVGLVLVYRVSRVLNFAHGSVGTLAALVFSSLWLNDNVPMIIALVLGMALAAALGVATDLIVVRPLRDQPPIIPTLATLGVAALLYSFAVRHYGSDPIETRAIVGGRGATLGGITILPEQFVMAGGAIAALAGLTLLIHRTGFGLQLRATAQDSEMASQLGVRSNVVSSTVWGLAGVLAALCAVLLAPQVSFGVDLMAALSLRGLVAALVGGLTSISGAFIAGLGLGVAESILDFQVSAPGASEAALALIVIVTLMLRPTGVRKAEY
jgi:branched-subunit amino acid ABC-type transport system permease component